ncbi:MAG: CAP domain-containing protein, partial [Acidimicrobiia bacterium]
MRRSVGFAAVAAAAVLATLLGVSSNAVGEPNPIEAQFVALINTHRAGLGLAAYEVHPQLEAKARAWSEKMADAGGISHSHLADGITAPWQSLGENVAMGPTVAQLHNALVISPRHLANFVHTSYRFVGVGVVERSGSIYVTQEFMQLQTASAAPPAAPVKSMAAPPRDPEPAPPTTVTTQPPAAATPAPQGPVAAPEKDPAAAQAGVATISPAQPHPAEPVPDPSVAMPLVPMLSPAEGVALPTSSEPLPAVTEVASGALVTHVPARVPGEAAATPAPDRDDEDSQH